VQLRHCHLASDLPFLTLKILRSATCLICDNLAAGLRTHHRLAGSFHHVGNMAAVGDASSVIAADQPGNDRDLFCF
jgi:hypothetical protein